MYPLFCISKFSVSNPFAKGVGQCSLCSTFVPKEVQKLFVLFSFPFQSIFSLQLEERSSSSGIGEGLGTIHAQVHDDGGKHNEQAEKDAHASTPAERRWQNEKDQRQHHQYEALETDPFANIFINLVPNLCMQEVMKKRECV
jgi:hypothetical protein